MPHGEEVTYFFFGAAFLATGFLAGAFLTGAFFAGAAFLAGAAAFFAAGFTPADLAVFASWLCLRAALFLWMTPFFAAFESSL